MSAKELNKAFIAACEECPQFIGFDDDQEEMVDGRAVNVAKLHKKGMTAVINYWRSSDTIGGSLIHESGYSACLPPDVVALLARVDSIIEKAIKEALGS